MQPADAPLESHYGVLLRLGKLQNMDWIVYRRFQLHST